ncbi:MAG: amidohydrolase family protein, partial [Chloroflexi bacterium]|nr:amidohydrolase family protein [Chloroflexota bacterium]
MSSWSRLLAMMRNSSMPAVLICRLMLSTSSASTSGMIQYGSELNVMVAKADSLGLQIGLHCIGDEAVFAALNAYRAAYYGNSTKMRHRIEHAQVIRPEDLNLFAEYGVIASMQPIHAPSDMFMADRLWGDRSALAYAWRTQLNYGAHLAFGSDAPVESPNPFLGLHAAVTRRRADLPAHLRPRRHRGEDAL